MKKELTQCKNESKLYCLSVISFAHKIREAIKLVLLVL